MTDLDVDQNFDGKLVVTAAWPRWGAKHSPLTWYWISMIYKPKRKYKIKKTKTSFRKIDDPNVVVGQ